jgi:hypothetical protein
MPAGKLKEQNMGKIIFLYTYSRRRKESDPDLLVRGTDPQQNVLDPQQYPLNGIFIQSKF